jgi:hypothetical protein
LETSVRQPFDTKYEDVVWHRDPAASGWRSRAFVGEFQLLAYDDGRWVVRLHDRTLEQGRSTDSRREAMIYMRQFAWLCRVFKVEDALDRDRQG